MNSYSVPAINFYPFKAIMYLDNVNRFFSRRFKFSSAINLAKNKFKGDISLAAKKNIKNKIEWLLASAKSKSIFCKKLGKQINFKISMITLTLPSAQIHDDNTIKKIALNKFLEKLRYSYGLVNYFWKAEKQNNGNIHFHLIVDKYIYYMDIRNIWNKCINALGYVDRFFTEHGHANPNSTDIHSIKKIRNLGAYVAKYVAKTLGANKIQGRIWYASKNLSIKKPIKIHCSNEQVKLFDDLEMCKGVRSFRSDVCKILYFDIVEDLGNIVNSFSDSIVKLKEMINFNLKPPLGQLVCDI